MTLLVQFFAWLMDWCHSWCPNYWADIVIFTFFTKILQFPVSLWCQVNSLKMVSLMPETNRIKINHYGDSDAIGEETAALFKREHYHPLLSLVPLAIQILILMAFVKVIYGIGDKLTVPGAAKPLIACVPWTDGGYAWLMPLFAGAAAWLLGYSQNIFNPLQHEQTRTQQLITNGISICISLFLGCFVAAGVGLYWATSNFFSIVVQWGENWCIPPKKHVDYPALRRSQAELKKFEADLKARTVITPEDRKREKEDYKRFFKVANKHLVFYAEGGGYYKYFQPVIEWLLAHTNVTIHYVTNDPKDPIFHQTPHTPTTSQTSQTPQTPQTSQTSRASQPPPLSHPHLRPYFIGNTRIIPLMMKMDADMVVMTTPDLNTFHIKRSYVKKDVEYVYLDHGPTSVHMCYRKGAFDHFDTIMCNGPAQVAEHQAIERVYGLKAKKLVETGYPLLDLLPTEVRNGASATKRIMIANSHQKDNIFDTCLDDLIAALQRKLGEGTQVVVRPHPQYVRRNPAKWESIKSRHQTSTTPSNLSNLSNPSNPSNLSNLSNPSNPSNLSNLSNPSHPSNPSPLIFEDDFSKPSTMDQSDVLITDWSGIAYEFAYKTRRPTLFIDTPMKVINPEWEKIGLVPTDISFRNEVGVSVPMTDMEAAATAVEDMVKNPKKFADKIDMLFKTQFFNLGHAGEVAGKYILNSLIERKKKG